jgi:hypothetical protein
MTIRAFECVRPWDDVPVTIFANNLDHAHQIYREWVGRNRPGQPLQLAAIFPYGEDRLEVRPHLDKAASLGTAGVGYWDVSEGSWVIGDPRADPLGHLAPPESNVSFYRVEDPGEPDVLVFANSFEEATVLFQEWHRDAWGSPPERFTIEKRSRWELMGDQATLRDGLDAGITGVARADSDGVWRILPPDWEPIYGRV